jgi:hypothetical protein
MIDRVRKSATMKHFVCILEKNRVALSEKTILLSSLPCDCIPKREMKSWFDVSI